jgi:hypothetical protein
MPEEKCSTDTMIGLFGAMDVLSEQLKNPCIKEGYE